jgi:hypothetical protein
MNVRLRFVGERFRHVQISIGAVVSNAADAETPLRPAAEHRGFDPVRVVKQVVIQIEMRIGLWLPGLHPAGDDCGKFVPIVENEAGSKVCRTPAARVGML